MKYGRDMKKKKHIYPVEFDPELYARLKQYAASHGKQSIGSVVRYAVELFLNRVKLYSGKSNHSPEK